jgi:hypothetical protein
MGLCITHSRWHAEEGGVWFNRSNLAVPGRATPGGVKPQRTQPSLTFLSTQADNTWIGISLLEPLRYHSFNEGMDSSAVPQEQEGNAVRHSTYLPAGK